tara:strand:- start:85 stop:468 length:384 start_codon:yes stop_codon:yes gene_type:complete
MPPSLSNRRNKDMYAIYTMINDRKTFIGKHIDNTIVREFSFRKAVLWHKGYLGFDKRLLDYAKDAGVKMFIFSEPVKQFSLKIGIRKFNNNKTTYEKSDGNQWYVSKHLMDKSGYFKTPYVKKEVML